MREQRWIYGAQKLTTQFGMTNMRDMSSIFRPVTEPARTIYDAFQAEARRRAGRSVEEWTAAEAGAVWAATRDYAQQNGLAVPTMAQIESAEMLARGHTDYGSKWAHGVSALVRVERVTRTGQ